MNAEDGIEFSGVPLHLPSLNLLGLLFAHSGLVKAEILLFKRLLNSQITLHITLFLLSRFFTH